MATCTDTHFAKCRRKYIIEANGSKYGDVDSLNSNDVGRFYEVLSAISTGMLMWEDTPLEWNLPARDMGIDLIDRTKSLSGQCKCFRKKNMIKWAKYATFQTLSTTIGIPKNRMMLYITPQVDCTR